MLMSLRLVQIAKILDNLLTRISFLHTLGDEVLNIFRLLPDYLYFPVLLIGLKEL